MNDYRTSTVDGAAAHARLNSSDYDIAPDASDVYDDPKSFVQAKHGGLLSGAEWDQWFANEWARVSAEADAAARLWTPDYK